VGSLSWRNTDTHTLVQQIGHPTATLCWPTGAKAGFSCLHSKSGFYLNKQVERLFDTSLLDQ